MDKKILSQNKSIAVSGDSRLHYGTLKIPEGKKAAVAITVDFDASSGWDGTAHLSSPAYLERGRFGAEFGVPRLLEVLDEYEIKTTWFIPGHTARTFPDACRKVLNAGHEVGVHGYNHENITNMSYEEENDIMDQALMALESIGCKEPASYRSPAWDYSPNTIKILEKHGFQYDSSLMTSDVYPFYNQNIFHDGTRQDVYEVPAKIITFPPSWYLDDFVEAEFALNLLTGLRPVEDIFDRWKKLYDFACTQKGACYVLTVHPQTIGRGHMLFLLRQIIEYIKERGAWFATVSEMGRNFIPNP